MAVRRGLWDAGFMSEHPADIDLDRGGPGPLPDPGIPPPHDGPRVWLWVGAGILLLVLAVAYVFLSQVPAPPPETSTKPAVQPTVKRGEAGELITLPPLDETDPIVRQLVQKLSSHPTVAAWLTTDGLLLNFVVVTTKIANGETPVIELKALRPMPRFSTRTSETTSTSIGRAIGGTTALPRLFRRSTRAARHSCMRRSSRARLRRMEGWARVTAISIAALERAIFELLSVPVVEGDVALEPHGAVYAFADPRLQEMSAAQKQLFRMGPQNVRVVQGKLRDIALHLGIPESRLPPVQK